MFGVCVGRKRGIVTDAQGRNGVFQGVSRQRRAMAFWQGGKAIFLLWYDCYH